MPEQQAPPHSPAADVNAYIEREWINDADGSPLVQAGVHRRMQSLIDEHPHLLIRQHAEMGATTQLLARIAWEVARQPELRILYIARTKVMAEKDIQRVVGWSASRERRICGIGGTPIGARFDRIYADLCWQGPSLDARAMDYTVSWLRSNTVAGRLVADGRMVVLSYGCGGVFDLPGFVGVTIPVTEGFVERWTSARVQQYARCVGPERFRESMHCAPPEVG